MDVSPFCMAPPGGGPVEDGVVSTYNKASISGDFLCASACLQILIYRILTA